MLIEPPAGMTLAAKKHFQQIAVEAQHRLQPYHRDTLCLYCERFQDLLALTKKLRSLKPSELVITRVDGQKQVSPLYKMVNESTKVVRDLSADLGLSPASESTKRLEKPDNVVAIDDPHAATKRQMELVHRGGK